jgi:hypothetical protein
MTAKYCNCCRKVINLDKCKFVGIQYFGKSLALKLYNCACGTTLAIKVPEAEKEKPVEKRKVA